MKQLTIILLLLTSVCFSQVSIKRYEVNCSNNTVIRDTLVVKKLTFVSSMLPMSYNSVLTVYKVSGNGSIVSPSTLTNRRPKKGEQEPKVILEGCPSDFNNLTIGKFVEVEYKCYDNLSN